MALTGGFQHAFWVLGAIALIAVPVILTLVGRDKHDTDPVTRSTVPEPQPVAAN